MITFPCNKCGKNFSTEDAYAGRVTACPSCGSSITVPHADAAEVPDTAPSRMDAPAEEEKSCPYCGELIKRAAVVCRFCKTRLDAPAAPATVPSQAPRRKSSNMVLWIVLGVFGAVALFCVLGIVLALIFGQDAFKEAFRQQCRLQLSQLHSSLNAYEAENETVPSVRGSAFWREVADNEGNPDMLICPGGAFKGRQIGYRGPAGPWEEITEEGIIACDLVGNHKDGVMVLLKNGRIEFAETGSELYDRALEETRE